MHEDADPIPRDGRRRKIRCFSSGDGDVAWPALTIISGFRIAAPDDIEIDLQVGFFKCAGEGFDGRQLRFVAGDGQVSGDVRKGDEGHSPAEQKAAA